MTVATEVAIDLGNGRRSGKGIIIRVDGLKFTQQTVRPADQVLLVIGFGSVELTCRLNGRVNVFTSFFCDFSQGQLCGTMLSVIQGKNGIAILALIRGNGRVVALPKDVQ